MDALRRFLQQFREYWGSLSFPRRAGIVTASIGILVALGVLIYLSQASAYRPLFTDLAPEEASAITSRLTAQNIPNRLTAGGTAVEVPEDKLAQARVAVASEGLPSRGGKGYELFDETSLLTTPFVQSVNYQRALQAELSRSIMQLEAVQSARVLIARPEPSPFVRDQKAPTASVIVKLKPGATLSRASSAGIVSLVARSVEGLKPENVTIVDSTGRLLSDPHAGDRDSLPAPQLEYRRELETYLATKAEQMLSQALGAGRAVVRVSADINFQQLKERQETFLPNPVVSAERLTTIKSSGGIASRGIAGAVSNVPRTGVALSGPSGAGSSTSEEQTQTDYAVSKTIRDLEDRMGAVTRLTIAALVDLSPGEGGVTLSAEDAEEIIKQAVGFRTGRDEVKLTNIRLGGVVLPSEPDETLLQIQRFQAYVSLARNVSLALAIVLALSIVPLMLLRRRPAAPPIPPIPPAVEAQQPSEADRRKAELERFNELARTEPDRVADIFKLLLGAPVR
jgi:flagellar M-ring protein FliF